MRLKAAFVFFIFGLTTFACKSQDKAVSRIIYFYWVKNHLSDKNWPGFGLPKYDVDLAYFTDKYTYIVDHSGLIAKRNMLTPVYQRGPLKINRAARLDEVSFHMSTAYEAQDSSVLWYHNPVVLCSDYEGVHQNDHNVSDLQTWTTMVMHEYFHGFQLKHPAFVRYANDSVTVSNTRLQSYYDENPWFKESVDKENQLLLNCLETNDKVKLKQLLKEFSRLRENRMKRFDELFKFNLKPQEDFLEKSEGSARYMEYQLYLSFKNFPVEEKLQEIDMAYRPSLLKKYKLEDKPWMYESNSVRYFYSTGFNMLRLLDKLKIEYKRHFFDDNRLTLYGLLCRI